MVFLKSLFNLIVRMLNQFLIFEIFDLIKHSLLHIDPRILHKINSLALISFMRMYIRNRVILSKELLLCHLVQICFIYFQAIDVWMGACTAFIFAALIEFTVVNYLWRRRQMVSSSPAKHNNIFERKSPTENDHQKIELSQVLLFF